MSMSQSTYVDRKIAEVGEEVLKELKAIQTAVYSGDPHRSPEDDVRFLLGLVHELARA